MKKIALVIIIILALPETSNAQEKDSFWIALEHYHADVIAEKPTDTSEIKKHLDSLYKTSNIHLRKRVRRKILLVEKYLLNAQYFIEFKCAKDTSFNRFLVEDMVGIQAINAKNDVDTLKISLTEKVRSIESVLNKLPNAPEKNGLNSKSVRLRKTLLDIAKYDLETAQINNKYNYAGLEILNSQNQILFELANNSHVTHNKMVYYLEMRSCQECKTQKRATLLKTKESFLLMKVSFLK